MNSIVKLARFSSLVIRRRGHQTSVDTQTSSSALLKDFNPSNYSVPLRPVTMEDTMEPYGSYKVAYAAENRKGNIALLRGIACFTATCLLFYHSEVWEGLMMPNLDNIMEDTEPFEFDKEGRVTV